MPSGKTRYLIIGDIGSNAWAHSTFGRKIKKAVEVRERGDEISIISEDHFFDCILGSNQSPDADTVRPAKPELSKPK